MRDFTGQLNLDFRGQPLRLLAIQAQGQQPDCSFSMRRESGLDPWFIDLRSNDLTTVVRQGTVPLPLPPLQGTTLQLSGSLVTPRDARPPMAAIGRS